MLLLRIFFFTSFWILFSLPTYAQTSLEDLVDKYLDEYDHFFYTLCDSGVKEIEKNRLERTNTKELFLNDNIRVFNDLNLEPAIQNYHLYDYINEIKRIKDYNVKTRTQKIIELKKVKGNIDVIVYVNKRVPKQFYGNNRVTYHSIKEVFGFKRLKKNRYEDKLLLSVTYAYQDKDKDGIVDFIDQCPNSFQFRNVNQQGCVDNDNDGFYPDAARNSVNFDPNDRNPCQPNLSSKFCDSDGDGVSNRLDQCPYSAPNAKTNAQGCTDADGDGFFPDLGKAHRKFDPNDRNSCIPAKNSIHCDSDRDGVANSLDQCPNTPSRLRAYVNARGCVDRDKDGRFPDIHKTSIYYDNNDRDPCVPFIKNKTCDCDLDGIVNAKDDCECDAGPKSSKRKCNGCPDSDGDGICDARDKCPRVKGSKKNGCPRRTRYPLATWAFAIEGGVGLPLEQFKTKGITSILEEDQVVNVLGYAKTGYNTGISLSYMPSHIIGFEWGLKYYKNPVDMQAISPLITSNLAANNISYTSLNLDSLNTYSYLYPNMSMFIGYFEEGGFMGFQLKGTIGLLTDFLLDNGISGELGNPVGTNNREYNYSFGINEDLHFPVYKASASIYFNLGLYDEQAIEIEGSYLYGNYLIEDNFAYDTKIDVQKVSLTLLSINAKFKWLF